MREIKFRAFDKATNAMIETGFHLMGEVMAFGIIERYIFENLLGKNSLARWNDIETMQFVGVRDRKGNEVYEGDIIIGTCSDNPRYVCEGLQLTESMGKRIIGRVFYSDLYAQFAFTTDDITYLDLRFGLKDFEVVGNIFEDKDKRWAIGLDSEVSFELKYK